MQLHPWTQRSLPVSFVDNTMYVCMACFARNCQESWDVCRNMNVHSYPTLMLMTGNEQHVKYRGARNLKSLLDFVLQRFPMPPVATLHEPPPPRSVVMVCVPDVYECEDGMEHRKLAASLSGIVGVYSLDCSQSANACKEWGVGEQPQAIWFAPDGKIVPFYPPLDGEGGEQSWGDVYSSGSLTEATLKMLPLPPASDAKAFAEMVSGSTISADFLGETAQRTWSLIGSGKTCEDNSDGIQRHAYHESVRGGPDECKAYCEQDPTCNAIDFYPNTGWCNMYKIPCSTPARYAHGAQSVALKRGSGNRGVLLYFIDATKADDPKVAELEREIRQMPHEQLERIGVVQRVVYCDQTPGVCAERPTDMPEVRLYKQIGHESYHGDIKAKAMLKWVHDSLTTNVVALSAEEVEVILKADPNASDGVSWFIDYYASWCPPCKEMLPHYRDASMRVEDQIVDRKSGDQVKVRFGSIDCNKYGDFCTAQGVTGYPSPGFYPFFKRTDATWFDGDWNNPDDYLEHINDIFNPPTTKITNHAWHNEWQVELHEKKAVWLVLLTAGNWCGPCQNMNKMIKQVAKESNGLFEVGVVNCDDDRNLCDFLDVKGYPQLRRYQSTPGNDGTNGQLSGFIWNGHGFPRSIIDWALEALPDGVEEMNRETFLSTVVESPSAWLVTYSCPRWCRPCARWRPQQKTLAYMLREHNVEIAHIDCDDHKDFCNRQGVRSYPKAMLYMPGGDDVRHLEISSPEQMADYLRQVVGVKSVEGDPGSFDHDEF